MLVPQESPEGSLEVPTLGPLGDFPGRPLDVAYRLGELPLLVVNYSL